MPRTQSPVIDTSEAGPINSVHEDSQHSPGHAGIGSNDLLTEDNQGGMFTTKKDSVINVTSEISGTTVIKAPP